MRENRSGLLAQKFLIAVTSLSMILAGCTTSASLRAKYAVEGDVCEPYRAPLYESQEHFNQQLVGSALIGALVGVGVGLLLGGKNRGKAALIGGAAGLAAGLGAGYLRSKASRAQSREELVSSIDSDIAVDNENLSELGQGLRALNDCRDRQLDELLADVKANRVDKERARVRLSAIRTGIANDNSLAEEIFGKVDERGTAYVEASAGARDVEQAVVLGPVNEYEPTMTAPLEAPASDTTLFALKNSNLRSAPTTDADVLGLVPQGRTVTQLEPLEAGNWYHVRFGDTRGFVHKSLLAESPASPGMIVETAAPPPEGKLEVAAVALPEDAPPVQRYVTQQADIKAQQQADQAYLEQKADTIDVLLAV